MEEAFLGIHNPSEVTLSKVDFAVREKNFEMLEELCKQAVQERDRLAGQLAKERVRKSYFLARREAEAISPDTPVLVLLSKIRRYLEERYWAVLDNVIMEEALLRAYDFALFCRLVAPENFQKVVSEAQKLIPEMGRCLCLFHPGSFLLKDLRSYRRRKNKDPRTERFLQEGELPYGSDEDLKAVLLAEELNEGDTPEAG